jgi:hypothetical protein
MKTSETGQETADEFISYGRLDWYTTDASRLHYVRPEEFTEAHRADMESDWAVFTPVRLACGQMASTLHIPGIFSRMSTPRCKGCCRAAGFPQGKGSPKNDDACRALLGLPVNRAG